MVQNCPSQVNNSETVYRVNLGSETVCPEKDRQTAFYSPLPPWTRVQYLKYLRYRETTTQVHIVLKTFSLKYLKSIKSSCKKSTLSKLKCNVSDLDSLQIPHKIGRNQKKNNPRQTQYIGTVRCNLGRVQNSRMQ